MADFVSSLVEMGFPKDKAEKAVNATGNRGVEPAMEWILNQADDEPAAGGQDNEAAGGQGNEAAGGTNSGGQPAEADKAPEVASSYKCEDCGKLFKSTEEMEFHAAKTQHSNFSESTEEKKPLTDEEKKEQLRLIEEKIKLKRLEREEAEKREALEKEKIRMKTGREIQEAKRRFEEQEMKEIAEQRRREKVEERLAREKVKAQIEADKLARKAKYGGGGGTPEVKTEPATSKPSESDIGQTQPAPKKDYTETKLQIRLPSGKTIVQTFGINEPLAAVRLYVELNRTDGVTGDFNLMTNFPRKVFQNEDYECPLSSLGLVPSAVLMVTKSA